MLKKCCIMISILLLIPIHLVYAANSNQPEVPALKYDYYADVLTKGEAADIIYHMIIQEGENKSDGDYSRMSSLYERNLRIVGKILENSLENPFRDLKEDDLYYQAVVVLHDFQIYDGVRDGKKLYAKSAEVLTREEGFVLIDNLGRFRGNNPNSRLIFADASEISEFAYDAVNDLVDMWLISGYPDHTIRPKEAMKRGDFLNLLNKAVKSPYTLNSINEDRKEYYQSTIQDEHITKLIELVLKDDIVTSLENSIFYRFNNYTNTRLGFGQENFVIEIQKEGKWYIVPRKGVDIDDSAYSLRIGESNPQYFFENKLKRYYDYLEDGHYRIIFRLAPRKERDSSEYIPFKPYEDLLCMKEFDVLTSGEQ